MGWDVWSGRICSEEEVCMRQNYSDGSGNMYFIVDNYMAL